MPCFKVYRKSQFTGRASNQYYEEDFEDRSTAIKFCKRKKYFVTGLVIEHPCGKTENYYRWMK